MSACRLLAAVGLVLALAPVAIGCGSGGKHPTPRGGSKEGGEEREREQATRGIPARDRVAYYHLATAAGAMRTYAVTGDSSARRRVDAAARRVAALSPGDPLLRRLRARLLRLGRAHARGSAAVREVDRITAGLRGYLRDHPGVGAVVPD